ncbi:MSMEG_6728 family protein [Umezawaea sp. REN6]|uniref:MSMEG_6728 family protein n=1 Tax=Umezawaea beigongshangensis TaxID=2780383 RepID=UPI0018F1827E
MQTFLPHADFAATAAVLDDRRLGKQRAETLQILRALVWPEYGWKHHPAVTMWRGFTRALVGYGVAICREWTARGHADTTLESLLEFSGNQVPDQRALAAADALPPWLGTEAVHLSHRSSLVRKDPQHYRRFFPDVPDDLPYTWPRPAFPHWPVRRGHPDSMPLDEASALLGVDELSPDEHAVLAEVLAGRSARLSSPAERAGLVGLLAGLCTPGRTLWVVAGTPVDVSPAPAHDPPPHAPPPHEAPAPARPKLARPAGPRELAATRDEWVTDPEFLFRRAGADTAVEVPDVGLVVLDGPLREPRTRVPVLRLHEG